MVREYTKQRPITPFYKLISKGRGVIDLYRRFAVAELGSAGPNTWTQTSQKP